MPANYIADFNSRPDCEYVENQSVKLTAGALDPFDAEWSARVEFEERVRDEDLRELDTAARSFRASQKATVLIVLNRPARRVTLKGTGKDGTKYYPTQSAAVAKAKELKRHFAQNGITARLWIPA